MDSVAPDATATAADAAADDAMSTAALDAAAVDTQLHDIATHRLPTSRGSEQRIDVYLELNELLRGEDSPATVRALCREAPALLREFHHDLQHATVRDVLHVCLRTLSYFMYHCALVAEFSDAQLSTFLADIVSLLFSTQDETTYKLCLWSLAMQNVEANRQPFLARIVEAFVHAIANPFKSRAIELQAMNGLHLLARKHPQVVAASDAGVQLWLRPVCSRLASSHERTRETACAILTDASRCAPTWSPAVFGAVRACIVQYAFPAMETHVAAGRNRDALQLWVLTLALLRTALAADLTVLNAILYVPEQSMRHGDAAVRLQSIEAWRAVLRVFRESATWFVKKSVVQLLVRPVLLALAHEQLHTIVHAAFVTWRATANALVHDFNKFSDAASAPTGAAAAPDALQANARKWKRWFDEAVAQVLVAALSRCDGSGSGRSSREEQRFVDFAAAQWTTAALLDGDDKAATDGVASATPTPGRDVNVDDDGDGDDDDAVVAVSANLFGLAFILPDILSLLEQLLARTDATATDAHAAVPTAAATLVDAIWIGVCDRLHGRAVAAATATQEQQQQQPQMHKLRLRLLRLCLEFAFGVSSSANSTATTTTAETDGMDPPARSTRSTARPANAQQQQQPIRIRWQLQLLRALLVGSTLPDELRALFAHQKSRLSTVMAARMNRVAEQYPTAARLLATWNSERAGRERIDFAARANALPCAFVYLLLECVTLQHSSELRNVDSALTTSDLDALRTVAMCVLQCQENADAVPDCHSELAALVVDAIERCDTLVRDAVRSGDALRVDALLDACCRARVPRPSVSPAASDLDGAIEVIEITSSASAPTPNDELPASSADSSTISPCLLESAQPLLLQAGTSVLSDQSSDNSNSPVTRRRSAAQLPPTTPSRRTPSGSAPTTPASASTTHSNHNSRRDSAASPAPHTGDRKQQSCIFPALVGSTESTAQLHHHFPLAFRPLLTLYKIKTVGDLSAMAVDQVKSLDIKDPVATVMRALTEFSGRKDRLLSAGASPFNQRAQVAADAAMRSAKSRPSPSPSPRRILKRASDASKMVASSAVPLESAHRKRARRSLLELTHVFDATTEDGSDNESERSRRLPKLADRVTFCLPAGEGDTRITRPGEDSQDANGDTMAAASAESSDDRAEMFALKLIQHLRRSVHYADKLMAEHERCQSDKRSETSTAKMHDRLGDLRAAHDVATHMSQQLQLLADTYASQCEKHIVLRNETKQ